ncbi:MAG TPA: TadE/TadG family type IV pilus assembly protein [Alphaproteobacteria bacterium]|nr:TadE/TadG family type IV pilus assembly protein [Alphaproteobacteria bacterium]
MNAGWTQCWRAFVADRRAVVLTEMAMSMPIIITIALAGFEIARYSLIQQKLDRLAATVADMVSQATSMSNAQLTQIFAATGPVMSPFAITDDGVIIVTSVSATSGSGARVSWQRSGGGTMVQASEVGTVSQLAVLPAGFVVRDGENVIIAETYYNYSPMFIPALVPPRQLYHRAMFRPRFGVLSTLN